MMPMKDHQGLPMSRGELDKWVAETYQNIMDRARDAKCNENERDVSSIRSGDSLVVTVRYGKEVSVYDCKIRRHSSWNDVNVDLCAEINAEILECHDRLSELQERKAKLLK